ncbi:MAG: AmmeMemoRadiSam system protein B [Patescibacteria group bacterium]|nr:AmmeMemoRadiSam system protein B [Patescibacteria group bacterium]
MNKKNLFGVFITLTLACVFSGCGRNQNQAEPVKSIKQEVISTALTMERPTSSIPISTVFIDPQAFKATNALKPFALKGSPIAGVVNHHVLAGDVLAQFFKTIKIARPDLETFIIISPDHFSQGRGVSTHGLTYVTPAGDAVVRKRWVFELEKIGVWDGTDQRAFENEHGVGALVPFIEREYPQAKIMPLFLRADLPLDQAEKVGEELAKLSDGKTFVVVSSDMSHGLKRDDASKRDAKTLRWLRDGDWDRLESATDKNTDSAVGFAVLHAYLQKKLPLGKGGQGGFHLLSHRQSADYVADPTNVTTYISGVWE